MEKIPGEQLEDPIMEVRDVSVQFDMDRGESRVLDNVSIDINRQEVLGVVGESGSGKSMFASSLLDAVVDPGELSGSIIYHPTPTESINILELSNEELNRFRWEEVSMVFQGAMSSFNPTMSIAGHFKETIKSHNVDMSQGMSRARELLSDLYLEPDRVLESYPHELSGGMQQRALIALSLVLEPKVLVMDEPTAALDLLMQQSIVKLLEELQEKYELTMLFITHDLPLVVEICDRVNVMYAFEFVETAPTSDILTNPGHPYTRQLLNTTPNIDAPLDTMDSIEGASPDPVNVPSGCSYHKRCPLADDKCREIDPQQYEVKDSHSVACHHWERAQSEIELSTEKVKNLQETDSSDGEVRERVKTDPVVSVNDLNVHFEEEESVLDIFGDTTKVRAVDGVSLDIGSNDVIALVGESGCGKTTLGKAMIGLQRPTDGSVRYRGQDIWEAKDRGSDVNIPFEEIRRSLQIIHQDPGSSLNPNKKVFSTLSVPLKKWFPDLSDRERRTRIYGMLDEVGMTPAHDYASRYPHQLSGGEKQRVALVRALLMNPDLILADEAISALDVSLRVEMMDLMLELQTEFDTSFVFVSHDLSNARYLAEKSEGRIAVMYLGEIVEVGPAEQIVQNPQHPYTKALRWATPSLRSGEETDMPLTSIDIPDPVDPPSGCRFHTRCPEAREACTKLDPDLVSSDGTTHETACLMIEDNPEYQESQPIHESDQ
jgi:peptide/nickel transport system ATP-binding protein